MYTGTLYLLIHAISCSVNDLTMSLLWVKLANHINKSMISSGIGYLPVYFSQKVAVT